MPHDFPCWQTVYYYFRRWEDDGTWERIHHSLRAEVRIREGRCVEPSAAIADTQSVKTAALAVESGYDGGKNVKGRKRHILVDTLGLLLIVFVHDAQRLRSGRISVTAGVGAGVLAEVAVDLGG